MIAIGRRVSTSYQTGPFRITAVSELCFREDCNPRSSAGSEAHYHITCRAEGDRSDSYLNGYRADGTSVWSDDFLVFHPVAVGENYDLFNND